MLQPSIDAWTISLMRKYNRDGRAVIYNTLQAYLKSARAKLEWQARLAREEGGWVLAIKLVRGAYMESEKKREVIWDTKEETDESYNSIVRDLLEGNIAAGSGGGGGPTTALFLASHNRTSVQLAGDLIRSLQRQGRLAVLPDFGQLQGMADQLGCELLQQGEDTKAEAAAAMDASSALSVVPKLVPSTEMAVPRVYKCLTWGSVQECMQYLVRRAVENRGGTGAMKEGMPALRRELRRRVGDWVMGRRRGVGGWSEKGDRRVEEW